MATLLPTFQTFFDTKLGTVIGIHRVTLLSSSDTVTVPALASSTAGAAVGELDDGNNDSGVTVTSSGLYSVTLTGGSAGGVVWFTTRHGPIHVNYNAETA
jgi:hypothetical protein